MEPPPLIFHPCSSSAPGCTIACREGTLRCFLASKAEVLRVAAPAAAAASPVVAPIAPHPVYRVHLAARTLHGWHLFPPTCPPGLLRTPPCLLYAPSFLLGVEAVVEGSEGRGVQSRDQPHEITTTPTRTQFWYLPALEARDPNQVFIYLSPNLLVSSPS